MKISIAAAERVVREEADSAERGPVDGDWATKVEEISRLCEGGAKTHIAFLGTAMIAKAVDRRVDLFAIKPDHAPDNPRAYSARVLSEQVLVPLAAELSFNIGVTGRQPLNNQPYFRMTRLGDGTPVHTSGQRAFEFMMGLVGELDRLPDEQAAREALRAFIAVRRRFQPKYADGAGAAALSPEQLLLAVTRLVLRNSEGGRRAQAAAAGLFDLFAGPDRVESGRINDPSRKYPGDVCVRVAANEDSWEKAVEVRDKPVAASDVHVFGAKCLSMGVRDAAMLMVSPRQPALDDAALQEWASARGLGLTLFYGWARFIDQVLFWSAAAKPAGATEAVDLIRSRLITVEVSPDGVELWDQLTRA